MTDTILEVAAYACLALGVALLIARVAGERLKRTAGIWRFRYSLRKLHGVPADWTKAMGAMEDLQDDSDRRDRPANRRNHRHPSEDR
ncbi:MAG: hypothetical protein QOH36_2366 [Actinomycetota bacterium]|nr:hypothetical protein [Actinomycetota bacterium]